MGKKVTSVTFDLLALVVKENPKFYAERRKELQYEFSGRKFYGDPDNTGAYSDE